LGIENRGRLGRLHGGKFESQKDIILRIIKDLDGATIDIIQHKMKIKRYVIRGRLSELCNAEGLVYNDNEIFRLR